MNSELCACFSGLPYKTCCAPFHGGEVAKRPLELLRARFAAYKMNLPDYIIKTTHPYSKYFKLNTFNWRRSLKAFSKECDFYGLKILSTDDFDPLYSASFIAYLKTNSEDKTFTEKSFFQREGENLYYLASISKKGEIPSLATKRPHRPLPLIYYPNPILKKSCEEITSFDEPIQELIEGMIDTMDAFYGIGIAAPQVGVNKQLFVIREPLDDGSIGDPIVFINPKIVSSSEKKESDYEGCLSLPKVEQKISRPKTIVITYLDRNGIKHEVEREDYYGRVLQHEYDHLQGTLLTDYMNKKKQLESKQLLHDLLGTVKR